MPQNLLKMPQCWGPEVHDAAHPDLSPLYAHAHSGVTRGTRMCWKQDAQHQDTLTGCSAVRPLTSTEGAAGQGWRLGSPWGTAVPWKKLQSGLLWSQRGQTRQELQAFHRILCASLRK